MSDMFSLVLMPRFIRLKDAQHYLGMDRSRFGAEVRPHVTEIRIGSRSVAFDPIELDTFADQYKNLSLIHI